MWGSYLATEISDQEFFDRFVRKDPAQFKDQTEEPFPVPVVNQETMEVKPFKRVYCRKDFKFLPNLSYFGRPEWLKNHFEYMGEKYSFLTHSNSRVRDFMITKFNDQYVVIDTKDHDLWTVEFNHESIQECLTFVTSKLNKMLLSELGVK